MTLELARQGHRVALTCSPTSLRDRHKPSEKNFAEETSGQKLVVPRQAATGAKAVAVKEWDV
jgi:hypothetical protein